MPRRLTRLQVRFVRDCYALAGLRKRGLRARLAQAFGVSPKTIWAIAAGTRRREKQKQYYKPRPRPKPSRTKTHCPRGHELTVENLYLLPFVRKDGTVGHKRQCRTCKWNWRAQYRKERP